MSKTVEERIAVIESKIDSIDTKIDTKFSELDKRLNLRFETQEKIDNRQDCQIRELNIDKANKEDMDNIKRLLYGLYITIIGSILTAILTKLLNIW